MLFRITIPNLGKQMAEEILLISFRIFCYYNLVILSKRYYLVSISLISIFKNTDISE